VKLTKKYINSGAPIRAYLEVPDWLIDFLMEDYKLTEEQAVLFYIQQQEGIEDMDLIHGRYVESFSFFRYMDNIRITINL